MQAPVHTGEMQFQISEAVQILERTPAAMSAVLGGNSPVWLNCRIDASSFSPLDVLGHLIFGELTDWIPRARLILECGNTRAFDPFDRRGFAPLIEGKTIAELLSQFGELRRKNIAELLSFSLGDRELDLSGLHPQLGEVNMRQLLATWVVHDLGHMAQVMRVMASQYREEVGPWREFLSIVA